MAFDHGLDIGPRPSYAKSLPKSRLRSPQRTPRTPCCLGALCAPRSAEHRVREREQHAHAVSGSAGGVPTDEAADAENESAAFELSLASMWRVFGLLQVYRVSGDRFHHIAHARSSGPHDACACPRGACIICVYICSRVYVLYVRLVYGTHMIVGLFRQLYFAATTSPGLYFAAITRISPLLGPHLSNLL